MIRLTLLPALLATPAAAQLCVEKPADLTTPVVLEPGRGAIMVGIRRPDAMSMGKSGAVAFLRYDPAAQEAVHEPRSARKDGDTRTYDVRAASVNRKAALQHAVMVVSAGDYVLAAAFKPAELRNGATYTCAAQEMTAYIVPGAPDVQPPVPPAAPAS